MPFRHDNVPANLRERATSVGLVSLDLDSRRVRKDLHDWFALTLNVPLRQVFGHYEESEFSIFSYDLYKHFRNNTHGFAELAAFQADGNLFGVRSAGRAEAAQGYPGEFVSGNGSRDPC